jgi:peptidoglycan/LPS O-acetylase OafA/YrhL
MSGPGPAGGPGGAGVAPAPAVADGHGQPAGGRPPLTGVSIDLVGRPLPPVTQVAVVSMALVIAGGIFMAAHMPAHAPLTLPVVCMALAAVLVVVNVAQLGRLRDFSWSTFYLVAKWSLVAYLAITGMLEYVFVLDGTRGTTLVVMTVMLALFALDVPMLLAFSVARYQPPDEPRP